MTIIVDTREKDHAIQHILRYFDRHGIAWEKKDKLDVGDYMVEGQPNLIVERKQSLTELGHNLLSKDKKRFIDEIHRAREHGVKLVILCEEGSNIHSIKDVMKWKPRYGKVSGRSLADEIFWLEIAYGVPTFFCGKRSTGKRILEILTDETGPERNRPDGPPERDGDGRG